MFNMTQKQRNDSGYNARLRYVSLSCGTSRAYECPNFLWSWTWQTDYNYQGRTTYTSALGDTRSIISSYNAHPNDSCIFPSKVTEVTYTSKYVYSLCVLKCFLYLLHMITLSLTILAEVQIAMLHVIVLLMFADTERIHHRFHLVLEVSVDAYLFGTV